MQGLVRLLGKDMSLCTKGKAAWALANMAEAEENKLKIAAFPGALEGLVRLLGVGEFNHSLHSTHQHRNERLVSAIALGNLNAAWALASLSDCKELKVKMKVLCFSRHAYSKSITSKSSEYSDSHSYHTAIGELISPIFMKCVSVS